MNHNTQIFNQINKVWMIMRNYKKCWYQDYRIRRILLNELSLIYKSNNIKVNTLLRLYHKNI